MKNVTKFDAPSIISCVAAAALLSAPLAAEPSAARITAPGPDGVLAGTILQSNDDQPLVIIIPGSGPTDRDGNNPVGVSSASYRLLAEGLAKRNVATLRIDKRGMFGSKAAIANANKVTINDYADDVRAWIKVVREQTGRNCLWVLGHSEGGLVALAAGQKGEGICGIITVAAAGRPLGSVLRDQLSANPANAPILPDGLRAIAELEAGKLVDVSAMHPALQQLYAPAVQPFLIDIFSHDPAALAASLNLPLLILQGSRDLQVSVADAQKLAVARPDATLLIIPGMTHVLKHVDTDDAQANYATYANPKLPVEMALIEAIADFVKL